MEQLKILTVLTCQTSLPITGLKISFEQSILSVEDKGMYVGVDPGTTHLGLAYIVPSLRLSTAFQITMERSKDPVERILLANKILHEFLSYQTLVPIAVIEGASYGSPYRQVELAEMRATSVLFCKEKGMDVKVIPPNTIRKQVFSNAKMTAHNFWKDWQDYPDAAAAVSCAVYGMKGE